MGDFFNILQFVLSETKAVLSTGMLLTLFPKNLDLNADRNFDIDLMLEELFLLLLLVYVSVLLSEEFIHMLNFNQRPQMRYLLVRLATDLVGLGICSYLNWVKRRNEYESLVQMQIKEDYLYLMPIFPQDDNEDWMSMQDYKEDWMHMQENKDWMHMQKNNESWMEFVFRNHGTYLPLVGGILKNLILMVLT